jgi:hypothetical protein
MGKPTLASVAIYGLVQRVPIPGVKVVYGLIGVELTMQVLTLLHIQGCHASQIWTEECETVVVILEIVAVVGPVNGSFVGSQTPVGMSAQPMSRALPTIVNPR